MVITLFGDDLKLGRTSKAIDWDRESIFDLITLLREQHHEDSLVQAEYPLPPNISKQFPHIIAMDKTGQCLVSTLDMSVEMLSDLYLQRDLTNKLKGLVDSNYLENKVHYNGMIFTVATLVTDEEYVDCYIERLNDRAFIYKSAEYGPALPSLDDKDIVEWKVVGVNEELSGMSPSMSQAIIAASLTSAQMN